MFELSSRLAYIPKYGKVNDRNENCPQIGRKSDTLTKSVGFWTRTLWVAWAWFRIPGRGEGFRAASFHPAAFCPFTHIFQSKPTLKAPAVPTQPYFRKTANNARFAGIVGGFFLLRGGWAGKGWMVSPYPSTLSSRYKSFRLSAFTGMLIRISRTIPRSISTTASPGSAPQSRRTLPSGVATMEWP